MPKIVECVPNFSEGRDRGIIDAICHAITSAEGVSLLDVDPGAETNRTVVTFIGSPEAAVEGAFRGIATAARLIDMSKHKGAHPRMGATDVCPFVPVSDVTMAECADLARLLGERVGHELSIPVFLYEAAASSVQRKNLSVIREGEYEGLPAKLSDPNWIPDFGPAEFNRRSGASVIGARPFLLAYNVNLNTRDQKLAMRVASRLREKGYIDRDADGVAKRDENGNVIMLPGLLSSVKGTGWYIPEYGCAQISMNLTNYHETPLHLAFEEARRVAEENGLLVTGSELVGLTPLEPMVLAGRYYLDKQGRNPGVSDDELIHIAVMSLGLSAITRFDPEKKIIEYRLRSPSRLVGMTVEKFVDELAADSPAPGGGSVSALAGSLGAGLTAMVASLTQTKKNYKAVWPEMAQLAVQGQLLKKFFLEAVDRDTDAFNRVMAAIRMPKRTVDEQAARDAALAKANLDATLVPLSVLETAIDVVELAKSMAERGNQTSLSDAGVGALAAQLAAEGTYMNVLINLPGVVDADARSHIRQRADAARDKVLAGVKDVRDHILAKLEAQLAR